jgi:hypothetical protein
MYSNKMNEKLEPRGYASLEQRKSTGAHYTPRGLADFVAAKIVDAWSRQPKARAVRLLDPAVGDGELMVALLRELSKRGSKNIEVFGFDTDKGAVDYATSRIKSLFPDIPIRIRHENFLSFASWCGKDDMFRPPESEAFDLVIANPPYVRTQVLGSDKAQKLSRQFGLSGRVDLYHAFILGIAMVSRPGGITGIIVSNRFMTTKAGATVRRNIRESFDVLHVWDLGDTKLFEAAVLPAVILVQKENGVLPSSRPRFTSIYSTDKLDATEKSCSNAIDALEETGIVKLDDGQCFYVQQGELYRGEDPGGVWRISNGAIDSWLATVEAHTYCTFRDLGKVRVGVKTNSNKVFIRSDWHKLPKEERPELLQPIITHHIARCYKALPRDANKKILYPHKVVDGQRAAVDLDEFPRSAKYLKHHRIILEKREYLIKSNRKWYEIWVPQDPNAWLLPKMVFRDISEKPTFWMDLSGAVVNGDCYWLACEQLDQLDLLWLALAVANSSFTTAFYDKKFHNKLYSSRRRFMTQYVENFPIPEPGTDLSKRIIGSAKRLFEVMEDSEDERLEGEINRLVWQAFGLDFEEVSG